MSILLKQTETSEQTPASVHWVVFWVFFPSGEPNSCFCVPHIPAAKADSCAPEAADMIYLQDTV